MSEVRIYKIDLTAGDFSYTPPAWQSSAWGGFDTPNPDYPEFGEMENVHRNEAAGASGQDVIDAVDYSQFHHAWITLCGVGNLANGEYDCRGGGAGHPIKCRWKQFLKSSALAEVGYCAALVLANGATGGTGSGLFSSNVFFQLDMEQSGGANFDWGVTYLTPNGTTFSRDAVAGSADVADDSEHEIIVTLVPSTVTGAFAGGGYLGSASVASDGSFNVTVDGVAVLNASGLPFVINQFATANPAVYFGKTIWHGD